VKKLKKKSPHQTNSKPIRFNVKSNQKPNYIFRNVIKSIPISLIIFLLPLVSGNTPTINHPSNIEYIYGEMGNGISWIVIDSNNVTGTYTVYLNELYHGYGVWLNNTNINYDADNQSIGLHNFTIDAWDNIYNVTDTVYVKVLSKEIKWWMEPNTFMYTIGFTVFVLCLIIAFFTMIVGKWK